MEVISENFKERVHYKMERKGGVDTQREKVDHLPRGELIELTKRLYIKRDRTHISNAVSSACKRTLSLEKRCGFIIGGLLNEFSEYGGGYKFDFDEVELHLKRTPELKLITKQGDLSSIVKKESPFFDFTEDVQYTGKGNTEVVAPLSNGMYIGALVVRNKTGIDLDECYQFLLSYADMAGGKINTSIQYQWVNHLLESTRDMVYNVVHDLKNPFMAIRGFSRRIIEKLDENRHYREAVRWGSSI